MKAPTRETMTASDPGKTSRDPLQAMLRWVPGFAGYADRDDRRQADAQQRHWLAERLERGKRGLERYARALVEAGQLEAILPVDRLRGQVDQLCHRLRGALQGGDTTEGFFTMRVLERDRLERIYQHDLALIERVAVAADLMEALGEGPTDANGNLTEIANQLAALADAWDAREDLLSE